MIEVPFTQLATFFEDDFNRIEKDLLNELQTSMVNKTPVSTGKLKNGWKIEGNNIINDVEYGSYVELGTIHNRPVGMMGTTLLEVDNMLSKINK